MLLKMPRPLEAADRLLTYRFVLPLHLRASTKLYIPFKGPGHLWLLSKTGVSQHMHKTTNLCIEVRKTVMKEKKHRCAEIGVLLDA